MKKTMRLLLGILILSMLAISLSGCFMNDANVEEVVITRENVVSKIDELNIKFVSQDLIEGELPKIPSAQNAASNKPVVMYELPDIENYPPIVRGKSANNVEVFLPLEYSGSAIENVVAKTAELYNSSHSDSSVTIRTLDNSLAEDFISSGAYLPDGYIAYNILYRNTLKENGINSKIVSDRLVGNTTGIAIKKEVYNQIAENSQGIVSYDKIFKACMDGKLVIGYLNPTNNPSGLNFVISMLSYFDSTNPFSMEATTDFSNFQNNAKVYYSTDQMKEALNRGFVGAISVDYQVFAQDKAMANYYYVPFGVRQDYPLLAIGNPSEEKAKVLKDFADSFSSDSITKLADSNGFNKNNEYVSNVEASYYSGIMNEILNFWKVDRTTTKKIAVYFVCDISGTMSGKKIKALKESALNAMQYISENSLVGVISYNDRVFHSVPLAEFNEKQQKYYAGAVNSWKTGGGTATNDAILMALRELDKAEKKYGEVVPLIILLSDGETYDGYSLKSVTKLIAAFDTPIYTIGYEANISELKAISAINNGVFMNASSSDVGYILKNLFNAET